jgi:arsenite methyltransferase
MVNCSTCQLFFFETEGDTCLHVNRPGGLELTKRGVELSGLSTGAKVLEVACGAGVTLDYLVTQMEMDALGLDASSAMLRLGKVGFPTGRMIQADGGWIPLADGSQQGVLMECALSLAGNVGMTLAEYNRILEPGGMLILTDIYIREVADPSGLSCLAATHCLSGAMTEDQIRGAVVTGGFKVKVWQDETPFFKQWLGSMVFKLGSLQAFYHALVTCDNDADALSGAIGNKIKLGYYLMIAEKQSM